jgi:hypothetical protein
MIKLGKTAHSSELPTLRLKDEQTLMIWFDRWQSLTCVFLYYKHGEYTQH